jgi:hypothetical protein
MAPPMSGMTPCGLPPIGDPLRWQERREDVKQFVSDGATLPAGEGHLSGGVDALTN